MRVIVLAFAVAAVCAQAAPNLCERGVAVVFSCQAGQAHKVVSLCSRGPLSAAGGELAYRFGVPGHVELEFPARGTPSSAKQFRYTHYFRYQVDRTEISFRIGEHDYTVFSYFDRDEKPALSEGVRVSTPTDDSVRACVGNAWTRFSALEAALPCDTDNALASCR